MKQQTQITRVIILLAIKHAGTKPNWSLTVHSRITGHVVRELQAKTFLQQTPEPLNC